MPKFKKEKKKSKLYNAIYVFDDFQKIVNGNRFGEDQNDFAITGKEAAQEAAKLNIEISGKLIPECFYVFRYSLNRDKLIPARVSMHPKTLENILKGSKKYGSAHILSELSEDIF